MTYLDIILSYLGSCWTLIENLEIAIKYNITEGVD